MAKQNDAAPVIRMREVVLPRRQDVGVGEVRRLRCPFELAVVCR